MISIITVCYNAKKLIEQTILSVINQDYDEKEFIIIDGASTDGTLEIIKKYRNRIDHFISEKDNGIYHAMNKGIQRAKGSFICFINAGDVFFSAQTLSLIAQKLNPNYSIVFGESIAYDYKAGSGHFMNSVFNDHMDSLTLFTSPINHQSIFFNREETIKLGNYDLQYSIYADYDLTLRLHFNSNLPFYRIENIVSIYGKGGLSDEKYETQGKKEINSVLLKNYSQNYHWLRSIMFKRQCLFITRRLINIRFIRNYLLKIIEKK